MRRSGPSVRAVSVGFFVAVLLASCSSPSGPPTGSGTATPSSAASAASSKPGLKPLAQASPRPTGQADWKTYTTPDGKFMFDYPPDWTVKDRAREAAPGGVFIEVFTGAGKSIATLRTNIVTKASCTRKLPYALMDSQELPALARNGVKPRFVFEGRDDHESYPSRPAPLSYGITSAPLPTGPSACPIFPFFNWPPGVAAFSGVYDPLVTTPGDTPDVDTPESYTGTEEYDSLRQMITSLRPAD